MPSLSIVNRAYISLVLACDRWHMARDAVCGMNVDERRGRFLSEHEGKTYCSCSQGCKAAFDSDQRKYIERMSPFRA
jgi:Cu+-exporting ATPase